MNALDLLEATQPEWFQSTRRGTASLGGLIHLGAWSDEGLDVQISDEPEPRVREARLGDRLPKACSERHIEGDGRFCLGLNRPGVRSRGQAHVWWAHLEAFIRCQSAAAATGVWPLGHGLDHGDAGEYHRRALRLSESLGISEAYLDAWLDQPSWISGEGLLKIGDRAGRSVRTGRHPRKPKVFGGRRARLKLLELVILERARRRRVAEFWRWARASGRRCCGTMRNCRLDRVGHTAGDDAAMEKAA